MIRRWRIAIGLAAGLAAAGLAPSHAADATPRPVRIMPVGDSITEGGTTFCVYRYPLWEKLHTAGYLVEYVGSRTAGSRIGPLAHEGYGGKNADFLLTAAVQSFRKTPADIVLLHAGHNYFAENKPVDGIVATTEKLIAGFRAANPRVKVLVAQVIPSGKLPKYSYIPALNAALGALAKRLNTAEQPVIAVDQATGFDWTTDTVADMVHPNARGAAKMADRWFEALTKVLEPPAVSYRPEIVPYKKVDGGELTLHVFKPAGYRATDRRPAIVFFFGGGWQSGTPLQFYPECAHFAAKGFVAVSADYRIGSTHHTTPFESVADGKSAVRWLRAHAAEWGIDPARIVAAGASAGGQVAAATATLPGLDDPADDAAVSSRPNAALLWYPVVDNGPDGYGPAAVKARYREFSPLHNISAQTPPTMIFLGTKDAAVPVRTAEEYQARMKQAGGRCELLLVEGAGHPIYEYRKGASPQRQRILDAADAFLVSLGFK